MLKTFFLPHGRMGRLRFWQAVAIIGIAYQVASLALIVVGTGLFSVSETVLTAIVFGPLVVALLSAAMVGAQRLHDRDRSSWWLVLALVPVGGAIWYLFANGTMSGTRGPNLYGPSTDGHDGEIAEIFGEGDATRRDRGSTGRLIGTIVLWLVLLAVTLTTGLLFQNPNPPRHAARDNPAGVPALTNAARHPI